MRSGTLPAPLLVGLGAACEVSAREMEVGVMLSVAQPVDGVLVAV